jgi:hypothetical protein
MTGQNYTEDSHVVHMQMYMYKIFCCNDPTLFTTIPLINFFSWISLTTRLKPYVVNYPKQLVWKGYAFVYNFKPLVMILDNVLQYHKEQYISPCSDLQ